MPEDKFIFVNAPTIINAGPRDARRELRSQLMRRVYLKKYKVLPPPVKDESANSVDNDLPISPGRCRCSHPSLDPWHTPPHDAEHRSEKAGKAKKKSRSRIPPITKLPTPPIDDDDELEWCGKCGGVYYSLNTVSVNDKNARLSQNIVKQEKEESMLGDPKMNIGTSFTDLFACSRPAEDGPNSNVLIQHFSQILLPALRPGHNWSQNLISEYINIGPDPLLFHVCCLTASVHLDKLMLWNGVESDLQRREIEKSHYRYTALRELRRAVAKPKVGALEIDILLVCICLLSVSDPLGELPSSIKKMDYNPFHHAFQPLGGLNIFGYQTIHAVHWKGLVALVQQRGGFDKIQLYGAKWKIAYSALKYALHTCTKPAFPICDHNGESLEGREPLDILGINVTDLSPLCGTGFMVLDMFSVDNSIRKVFMQISQVAQSMNILIPRRDDTIVRDMVADARNLVQYRFQTLPNLNDDPYTIIDRAYLEEKHDANPQTKHVMEHASSVYGLCWVVAYLFTTHVTFPVPSSRRFRSRIIYQIRDSISNCEYTLCQNPSIMRLQLWSVVIAGIAAEDIDLDLRQWMALKARDLYTRLGLQSWDEVVDVMISFAWMDVACTLVAMKFWSEVSSYDD